MCNVLLPSKFKPINDFSSPVICMPNHCMAGQQNLVLICFQTCHLEDIGMKSWAELGNSPSSIMRQFVSAMLFKQPQPRQDAYKIPATPGGHWQLNELSSSIQEPPFRQGWLRHSFTSISQLLPEKVLKEHSTLTYCFYE